MLATLSRSLSRRKRTHGWQVWIALALDVSLPLLKRLALGCELPRICLAVVRVVSYPVLELNHGPVLASEAAALSAHAKGP